MRVLYDGNKFTLLISLLMKKKILLACLLFIYNDITFLITAEYMVQYSKLVTIKTIIQQNTTMYSEHLRT